MDMEKRRRSEEFNKYSIRTGKRLPEGSQKRRWLASPERGKKTTR